MFDVLLIGSVSPFRKSTCLLQLLRSDTCVVGQLQIKLPAVEFLASTLGWSSWSSTLKHDLQSLTGISEVFSSYNPLLLLRDMKSFSCPVKKVPTKQEIHVKKAELMATFIIAVCRSTWALACFSYFMFFYTLTFFPDYHLPSVGNLFLCCWVWWMECCVVTRNVARLIWLSQYTKN